MIVLFEDNHLFVVEKEASLLTQPTDTDNDSVETRSKAFIKARDNKPGNVYLHAIHRLDRPVGGIVIFAKTSKSLSRLQEAIRKKEIRKTYLSLVEGELKQPSGELVHKLSHGSHRAVVDPNGATARLLYKVVEKRGKTTLVEIELDTGRYHQIRAQFAAIGCPVVGDEKYGSTMAYLPGAIALHHSKCELTHPVLKTPLCIESTPPFV